MQAPAPLARQAGSAGFLAPCIKGGGRHAAAAHPLHERYDELDAGVADAARGSPFPGVHTRGDDGFVSTGEDTFGAPVDRLRQIEVLDLARYAMMAVYGGVYIDMDAADIDFDRLAELAGSAALAFPWEKKRLLGQSMLVSPKAEPMWRHVVSYMLRQRRDQCTAPFTTGPDALTSYVSLYGSAHAAHPLRLVAFPFVHLRTGTWRHAVRATTRRCRLQRLAPERESMRRERCSVIAVTNYEGHEARRAAAATRSSSATARPWPWTARVRAASGRRKEFDSPQMDKILAIRRAVVHERGGWSADRRDAAVLRHDVPCPCLNTRHTCPQS